MKRDRLRCEDTGIAWNGACFRADATPPAKFVRVMLMKVVAAISDEGSTPSSSTKVPEVKRLGRVLISGDQNCPMGIRRDLLIGFRNFDGAVMVSTGSIAGTGDIMVDDYHAGNCKQRKPTIAKPMVMAAAA